MIKLQIDQRKYNDLIIKWKTISGIYTEFIKSTPENMDRIKFEAMYDQLNDCVTDVEKLVKG